MITAIFVLSILQLSDQGLANPQARTDLDT